MLEFYSDGGFFMHPILLIGLGGIVAGVVQLVLARNVNLIPVVIGACIWTVLLGLLGTATGAISMFEAVATAPPDTKAAMLLVGGAISLNPTMLALGIGMLQVVVGSVAVTVRMKAA